MQGKTARYEFFSAAWACKTTMKVFRSERYVSFEEGRRCHESTRNVLKRVRGSQKLRLSLEG